MGDDYLLQEENWVSGLSYVSDSETGPAWRGHTQDDTPLGWLLMDGSLERPAPGGGHVNKPELVLWVHLWINALPTDKQIPESFPSRADEEAGCSSVPCRWLLSCQVQSPHGMIWGSPLHLMLCMLSRDFWGPLLSPAVRRRHALPLIWEPGTLSK